MLIYLYIKISKKTHNIYTTDEFEKNNIFNFLPNTCKKISFPYIYDNSFYPFKGPFNLEEKHMAKNIEIVYDNSKPLIELFEKSLSLEKVIKLFKEGEINFDFKKEILPH